jgi:hypothetical protein
MNEAEEQKKVKDWCEIIKSCLDDKKVLSKKEDDIEFPPDYKGISEVLNAFSILYLACGNKKMLDKLLADFLYRHT